MSELKEKEIRELFKTNADKRMNDEMRVIDVDVTYFKAGTKVMTENKFVEVLLNLKEKTCEWKHQDFGMFGFHDYEYVTSCGKNYDCDKVKKEKYCPNCGGKIV